MATMFWHNGMQYRAYSEADDGFVGYERREQPRPGRDRYVPIRVEEYYLTYIDYLTETDQLDTLNPRMVRSLRFLLGDIDALEEAQALKADLRLNAPEGC